MRFTLMCCFDEQRWNQLPQSQRDKIMADYGEFEQRIAASGHYIGTVKLEAASTAATIRSKNGKKVVTDGPFAETKEQLGGIHLIECKDIEEAISIAEGIPTLPAGGVVEVRPVMHMTGK